MPAQYPWNISLKAEIDANSYFGIGSELWTNKNSETFLRLKTILQ